MFKLSVLISCYNSELFIENLVDSIYSCGLIEDEFEVVAFNDGSKDNTSYILDRLSSTYRNLRILGDGKNHGIVYAKNFLLNHADGKYIWLIDHDDELPSDVGFILNPYLDSDFDIISFLYDAIDVDGKYVKLEWGFNAPDSNNILGKTGYMNYIIHPSFCNKLINNCFVKKYNLQIEDDPDDWDFMVRAFFKADNTAYVNKVIYYWRHVVESESRSEIYFNKTLAWFGHLMCKYTASDIYKDKKYWTYCEWNCLRMIFLQTYLGIQRGISISTISKEINKAFPLLRKQLLSSITNLNISKEGIFILLYLISPKLLFSFFVMNWSHFKHFYFIRK